jgi:membrane protease YdiL (CAAX protease family)
MLFKNKYGEIRAWVPITAALGLMYAVQLFVGTVIGVALIIIIYLGDFAELGPEMSQEYFMNTAEEILENHFLEYALYAAMVVSLLFLFKLIYKRPIRQMGLYREGWLPQVLLGAAFGIGAFTLAVALLVVTGTAEVADFSPEGLAMPSFWGGLVFFIFVGSYEELLSRGMMMTALKTTRRLWVVVAAPAVLFGLMHFMNPNVTVFSIINIALVGLVFAYLFIKTGRLWAPIGYHITWNFVQGYVFGVPVSGTPIPDSARFTTTPGDYDWFTGGAFGAEGGAACTIVILLSLAFVRFCVKAPEEPERFWRWDGDMPLTRGWPITEAAAETDASPETDAESQP